MCEIKLYFHTKFQFYLDFKYTWASEDIFFYSFVSVIFAQVLFIALLCRSYFCTADIPDSQRLYLATPINTTGADLVRIYEILKTPLYSEMAVSLIVCGLVSEYACVCACVRACVRAFVCVCVCVCV